MIREQFATAAAHLHRKSENGSEGLQLGRCRDEPLPSERVEIILNRVAWVSEPCRDLLNGGAEEAGRKAHLVAKKSVRMLHLNAERSERGVGKILEVLGDDHVAAAGDGCSEDVAVARIGQGKGRDKCLIAEDQRIAGMAVHEVARAFE